MCSKKWAKPVRPSSNSSREPVRTIDQYATSPSLGIDTTMTFQTFAAVSDGLGNASVANLVTTLPPGFTFYAQYVWFNPAGCGPGTRSASNALEVIVQ